MIDGLVEQNLGWVPYTQVANLTGRPAINVPLYWTGAGQKRAGRMLPAPGQEASGPRLPAPGAKRAGRVLPAPACRWVCSSSAGWLGRRSTRARRTTGTGRTVGPSVYRGGCLTSSPICRVGTQTLLVAALRERTVRVTVSAMTASLSHRLRLMTGRDPHENGRVATSLELFYDLVFVVGFSVAGIQVGHALAEGHFQSAIIGYLLCTFAATWAWINSPGFTSAFDTDDWFFRLTVLVQMIGVAIIAIGIPAVFTSLEGHEHLDNRVLVIGYIVMRIGMVAQWLRAAAQSPAHRKACLTYVVMTVVAQLGWIVVAFADMAIWPAVIVMLVCACRIRRPVGRPLLRTRGTYRRGHGRGHAGRTGRALLRTPRSVPRLPRPARGHDAGVGGPGAGVRGGWVILAASGTSLVVSLVVTSRPRSSWWRSTR